MKVYLIWSDADHYGPHLQSPPHRFLGRAKTAVEELPGNRNRGIEWVREGDCWRLAGTDYYIEPVTLAK